MLPHINRTCKQVFASAEGEVYNGCSKTKQENSCSIGSNCIPSILCEAVKSGGGKERAHMEWQGPPESKSTTQTRSHQGVFWGAGWNILASHGGRDKAGTIFSRKLSRTVPVLSRLSQCLEMIYYNVYDSITEPPREDCLQGGDTALWFKLSSRTRGKCSHHARYYKRCFNF